MKKKTLTQIVSDVKEPSGVVTKGGQRESRPPVTLDSGAVYTGEWLNDVPDGTGTMNWPDSSKYEGMWVQGKAHGQGTLYHADGDVYAGEWVSDKADGEGTYTHANGAKYVGGWRADK